MSDDTTYTIHRDFQFRSISVEPSCHDVDELLSTTTIVAAAYRTHGYRLDRRQLSLMDQTAGQVNAGLTEIVAHAFRRQGHAVEIAPAWISHLDVPPDWLNPHVATFMHGHAQGVIRHHLDFDGLVLMCADIARAFPAAQIGFVEVTNPKAKHLHARLAQTFSRVTLALAGQCRDPGAQVAVLTPHGLAHADLVDYPFDVLVAIDAAEAAGEHGQIAMFAHGRARLYGLLRDDCVLAPRTSDLVMAMFGPQEVTVPAIGYQTRPVQVAWTRIRGGRVLAPHLDDVALYRHGIAGHSARNGRIVAIARALIKHSSPASDSRAATQRPCHRRTIVLCRNVEHGIELARRLRDWPLVTGSSVCTAGLSRKQHRVFNNCRAITLARGCAIATLTGVASMNLLDYDVVVWAVGGISVPTFGPRQLVCAATEERPLLWLDFVDQRHPGLLRGSHRRRRAYCDRGWFPVGTSPVDGRIGRFLAQRRGAR